MSKVIHEKMSGGQWVAALRKDPMLAGKCEWEKLSGDDWRRLLKACPQFADKCDWSKLNGKNWQRLLATQPQFASHCDWSTLDGEDWKGLLISHPQICDKCDWDMLDGDAWERILAKRPWLEMVRHVVTGKWNKLDGCHWAMVLKIFPSLGRRFGEVRLSSGDWCFFLTNGGPEVFRFAEKCKWSEFGVGEWVWLLAKCPQFADKCDWDMMNKKCPDWDYLLSEQPQLAKYRKLHGGYGSASNGSGYYHNPTEKHEK